MLFYAKLSILIIMITFFFVAVMALYSDTTAIPMLIPFNSKIDSKTLKFTKTLASNWTELDKRSGEGKICCTMRTVEVLAQ